MLDNSILCVRVHICLHEHAIDCVSVRECGRRLLLSTMCMRAVTCVCVRCVVIYFRVSYVKLCLSYICLHLLEIFFICLFIIMQKCDPLGACMCLTDKSLQTQHKINISNGIFLTLKLY